MSPWDEIDAAIADATGEPFRSRGRVPVGGGSINAAYRVESDRRTYFVKLNHGAGRDMFEAEAAGLAALGELDAIRVPAPICTGVAGEHAFLALEHIALGPLAGDAAERLGRGLALMHRHTGSTFGWHRDNTIGSTPQRNSPSESWIEFFRRERLEYQLALAAERGYTGELARAGARLGERMHLLFVDNEPAASLLHGDLWSGNAAADGSGNPVLFDPAVYHGDREADVAMTELFGGFPDAFHRAYRDAWPLPAGYRARRYLYNLYHVLNHLNLFGGGYLAQAENLVDRVLREIG